MDFKPELCYINVLYVLDIMVFYLGYDQLRVQETESYDLPVKCRDWIWIYVLLLRDTALPPPQLPL